MTRIDALERMPEQDREGAFPRCLLGNEYHCADDPASAMTHLRRAVEHAPDYSAGWRALGKAAERGDKQAADEIQLFLRRLGKGSR